MKNLKETAQEYVDLRRALGYKLTNVESLLKDFAAHMEREKTPYITSTLALQWAKGKRR